jgi:chorismate mutase
MIMRDGQGRNGGIGMASLEALRKKVRQNDEKMILLMGKRMKMISAVGRKKKALGLPLRDTAVERAVIRNAKRAGKKAGLETRVVVRVMNELMAESRRRQKKIYPRTGRIPR